MGYHVVDSSHLSIAVKIGKRTDRPGNVVQIELDQTIGQIACRVTLGK